MQFFLGNCFEAAVCQRLRRPDVTQNVSKFLCAPQSFESFPVFLCDEPLHVQNKHDVCIAFCLYFCFHLTLALH